MEQVQWSSSVPSTCTWQWRISPLSQSSERLYSAWHCFSWLVGERQKPSNGRPLVRKDNYFLYWWMRELICDFWPLKLSYYLSCPDVPELFFKYPTRQALVIAQIADEHWNARFAATSARRLSQNPAKSCKWDDIVSRTSCWLFWVPHSMPLIIISNTKEDTFRKICTPRPTRPHIKIVPQPACPTPKGFQSFNTALPQKNQVLPCRPNPPQNISSCPILSLIKKMQPQTSHVIIFGAPNMVERGIPE